MVGLRYALVRRYRRLAVDADAGYWYRWFLVGAAATGLAWGSAALFAFPPTSVLHQAFLILVLGALAAGAVGVYSVTVAATAAFAVPVLLPVVVRLLLEGSEVQTTMAGIVMLFGGLGLMTAGRVRRVTTNALKLRFFNKALVSALERRIGQAESLNAQLRKHGDNLEALVAKWSDALVRSNRTLAQ